MQYIILSYNLYSDLYYIVYMYNISSNSFAGGIPRRRSKPRVAVKLEKRLKEKAGGDYLEILHMRKFRGLRCQCGWYSVNLINFAGSRSSTRLWFVLWSASEIGGAAHWPVSEISVESLSPAGFIASRWKEEFILSSLIVRVFHDQFYRYGSIFFSSEETLRLRRKMDKHVYLCVNCFSQDFYVRWEYRQEFNISFWICLCVPARNLLLLMRTHWLCRCDAPIQIHKTLFACQWMDR